MRHATHQELNVIYGHFQNRRDWFDHVRKDRLERRIVEGQCIYQDGVVITYQHYKRAGRIAITAPIVAKAGDIVIHQILNSNQFNGAGGRVLDQFIKEMVEPFGCGMFLQVREDNKVARAFYERHGMKSVSKATWADTIRGRIYSL